MALFSNRARADQLQLGAYIVLKPDTDDAAISTTRCASKRA